MDRIFTMDEAAKIRLTGFTRSVMCVMDMSCVNCELE